MTESEIARIRPALSCACIHTQGVKMRSEKTADWMEVEGSIYAALNLSNALRLAVNGTGKLALEREDEERALDALASALQDETKRLVDFYEADCRKGKLIQLGGSR